MVFAFSIIFIFLIIFVLFIQRGRIFSPIVLTLLFLFFGVMLRALYLVGSDEPTLIDYAGLSTKQDALLVPLIHYFLATVFILIGYYSLNGNRGRKYDNFATDHSYSSSHRLKIILLSAFPVGSIIMFIYLGAGEQELINYFSKLQGRTIDVLRGRGHLRLFLDFSIVSSVSVFAFTRHYKYNDLARILANVSVLIVLFTLPLLGGRGQILQYILSLTLVRYLLAYKNRERKTGIRKEGVAWVNGIIIITVMVIVIVVGLANRQSRQANESYLYTIKEVANELGGALTGAIPLIDSYALAKKYTNNVGPDYGKHFLNYFAVFIPRAIWASKPDLLGIEIRRYYWGDSLTGIPPTFIGEFYISFGIVGVLGSSILYGCAIRRLSCMEKKAKINLYTATNYSLILPIAIFTVLRSGLEGGLVTIFIYIVMLQLIKKFLEGGKKIEKVL